MNGKFNILNFDPSVNAYIEASAGTGKTYTIQRIVTKLIGMGTARLPEILLVTYTDKATGELKDRFRNALSDVGLAAIYTMHSFCERVISASAFEASSALTLAQTSDDAGTARV